MEYLQTPPKIYVDYLRSVQRFVQVMLRVIPEINVRNRPASWVLTHQQYRARQSVWHMPEVRRLNLDDATLKPKALLDVHLDALHALQLLNISLLDYRLLPASKVPQVVEIMARYPVLTIRLLAENAHVSEATAKRWLKSMTDRGVLDVQYVNGHNQYLNPDLLGIIDRNAR